MQYRERGIFQQKCSVIIAIPKASVLIAAFAVFLDLQLKMATVGLTFQT